MPMSKVCVSNSKFNKIIENWLRISVAISESDTAFLATKVLVKFYIISLLNI